MRAQPNRRRRQAPLAVVIGLLLLAGLGVLLALNTASAAEELRQRSLTDSNADTSDAQQQLLRDVAQQQAPGALASAAAALGLIPNSNPAFLQLHPDGSVSVLGVPAPATVAPTPTPTPTVTPAATVPAAVPVPPTVAAAPVATVPPGAAATPVATVPPAVVAATPPVAPAVTPVVSATAANVAAPPVSSPTASPAG